MRPVSDVRALPGEGIEALVDGSRIYVGRPDHAGEPDLAVVRSMEAAGRTVVVVQREGQTLGYLAVADELRPEASAAVAALRDLGIGRLVMLTGDNERAAAAIAASVNLSEWRAGLLPEGKTAAIAALRRQGTTAMVGNGVNDAPALGTADVGVAMGVAGTDVALETADVALMADDLAKLPVAIRLARRALTVIRQNIALSLLSVLLLDVAALAGWLSLTTGRLLNEGTALLIIANGLRLLRRSG